MLTQDTYRHGESLIVICPDGKKMKQGQYQSSEAGDHQLTSRQFQLISLENSVREKRSFTSQPDQYISIVQDPYTQTYHLPYTQAISIYTRWSFLIPSMRSKDKTHCAEIYTRPTYARSQSDINSLIQFSHPSIVFPVNYLKLITERLLCIFPQILSITLDFFASF